MIVKKKSVISIVIGIVIAVFVILFGIASLSDEVLLEPPSVDTSEVQTGEEKKITVPSESISTKDQSEPEEEVPENVIKIKISDGVGTGDR